MTADTSHATSNDRQASLTSAQENVPAQIGGEAQTLVAKGSDVPLAARGALETEGTAATEQEQGPAEAGGIRALLFAPDAEPRAVPLRAVPELAREDRNFVWVDLEGYAQQDLQRVAGLLELPVAAVETTLAEWKRPRVQVFGDRLYVTATVPQLDPEAYRVEAQELDLFLGPNVLVSAHKQALPFGERILARARQNPTLLDQDAIFLLYLFLDELVGY